MLCIRAHQTKRSLCCSNGISIKFPYLVRAISFVERSVVRVCFARAHNKTVTCWKHGESFVHKRLQQHFCHVIPDNRVCRMHQSHTVWHTCGAPPYNTTHLQRSHIQCAPHVKPAVFMNFVFCELLKRLLLLPHIRHNSNLIVQLSKTYIGKETKPNKTQSRRYEWLWEIKLASTKALSKHKKSL